MFELRKIGIVKRASAWLLDAILLAVLATGFMYVVSLICHFEREQKLANAYYAEWEDYRKEYIGGVAAYYGFTYEESEDGETYTLTKGEAPASLEDVVDALSSDENRAESPAMTEAYEKYLLLTPADTVDLQIQLVYNLLFMMVSIGILLAYVCLEFIVPTILKNGQTIGKKVFGICLVRPDCVKITNISLFARTILGKFAIETMFPILLVFLFIFGGLGMLAVILLLALFILNTVLFFATKNRTPIHDIFAGTVVVDMKLQMIYESPEDLIAKKELLHNEYVENLKS